MVGCLQYLINDKTEGVNSVCGEFIWREFCLGFWWEMMARCKTVSNIGIWREFRRSRSLAYVVNFVSINNTSRSQKSKSYHDK